MGLAILANPGQTGLGVSSNHVLYLMPHVEAKKWHKSFTKNWHAGNPSVLNFLNQGIAVTKTIKSNSLTNCKMPNGHN